MRVVNYYVDPGAGFVFMQNSFSLWPLLLGLLGGLLVFFKFFFRFFRRFFWALVIILLSILIIGGLTMLKPDHKKKIVILGIDAMDPHITERLMKEGRLPNFSRLKSAGAYSHLATTVPSESAVAWTSFATGLNPGGHGVYDFIMRDPNTYFPYLSLSEVSGGKGGIEIRIRKKGDSFWSILSRNKIPSFIYFCPNTFPPDAISGRIFSGMGVPDLYGTIGRFSFYTSAPLKEGDKESTGKIVHVEGKNNIIETSMYGPKISSRGSSAESTVPLRIVVDPKDKKVLLEFQGKRLSLEEGRWTGFENISFKVGPFKKAHGIAKFYLKSIAPEFNLYLTAINFDPRRPLFPISHPRNYSKELAQRVGLYYTQGMPHDAHVWALTEGRIDEKVFLEQVDAILNDKEKILKDALSGFKGGALFFYFDTLDMVQHTFWRYLDPRSPFYGKDPLYKDTIYRYYEEFDRILGEVLGSLDKDTALIALSDHGFTSFRRAVHLNSWLLRNGYLFLKGGKKEGKEFFEEVDWSRTRAYALGFGGIYLNKIGREYYGIVSEAEAPALKAEIIKGLERLRDPETGEAAVNNVYAQEDIFFGPCVKNAPDLYVGFNSGYRASWQTALGGVPVELMEDNEKKWSGDHMVDPVLVKAVVFANRKITSGDPSIYDIVPTILDWFGIAKPAEMKGNNLFKDED